MLEVSFTICMLINSSRCAASIQPWITPSIFESTGNNDIVDEFTLGDQTNSTYALDLLEQHWETWITEDDFKAIKAAGLNHVR